MAAVRFLRSTPLLLFLGWRVVARCRFGFGAPMVWRLALKQARMANSVLVGCLVLVFGTLAPSEGRATCGEECDGQYSSAIDDCRSQYGDDPADADDLTNCIQEARADYRSCLNDCASAKISQPRWRAVLLAASEHRSRSVAREFQREHPCPSTGGTTGACPGYWKDHIVPLACGGPDAVSNMQWQTVHDARAKDQWERRICGR
jgi:hypothetical protein